MKTRIRRGRKPQAQLFPREITTEKSSLTRRGGKSSSGSLRGVGFVLIFYQSFEMGFAGRKLEQTRGGEPSGKPALGKEKRETCRAEPASCVSTSSTSQGWKRGLWASGATSGFTSTTAKGR